MAIHPEDQPSANTAPPPFTDAPITNDDAAVDAIDALLRGEPKEPVAAPPPESAPEREAEPAPAEEQPSGDTEDDAPEPEAEASPIPAPSSWKADAKEAFRKLPRDLQEIVLSREQERDAETRRAQNEAAEQRKAIEAERQAASQERNQYAQRLQHVVPALEAQISNHPLARMTPEQRAELARTNPAEFVALRAEFENQTNALNAARFDQQQMAERQRLEAQEQLKARIERERQLMAEKHPDLVDEKTGPQTVAKIKSLMKGEGFSDEDIAGLVDHRTIGLLKLALRGKEAMEKAKTVEKKIVQLPKVAKPGVKADPDQVSHQKRTALKEKLRTTTDDREAAAILEQLM